MQFYNKITIEIDAVLCSVNLKGVKILEENFVSLAAFYYRVIILIVV